MVVRRLHSKESWFGTCSAAPWFKVAVASSYTGLSWSQVGSHHPACSWLRVKTMNRQGELFTIWNPTFKAMKKTQPALLFLLGSQALRYIDPVWGSYGYYPIPWGKLRNRLVLSFARRAPSWNHGCVPNVVMIYDITTSLTSTTLISLICSKVNNGKWKRVNYVTSDMYALTRY